MKHRQPTGRLLLTWRMLFLAGVIGVGSALVWVGARDPGPRWAEPAQAAAVKAIPVPTVTVKPLSARKIEVVDAIAPAIWDVKAAVKWLDTYTGSTMKVVTKCSGKADRCVTIKSGTVKQAAIAWSSGSTITVDLVKAKRAAYWKYYKKAAHRKWLLVHELGHQFGLGHSAGRDIMNAAPNRYRMIFTVDQKRHLTKR